MEKMQEKVCVHGEWNIKGNDQNRNQVDMLACVHSSRRHDTLPWQRKTAFVELSMKLVCVKELKVNYGGQRTEAVD
jgi:hypothetical protein